MERERLRSIRRVALAVGITLGSLQAGSQEAAAHSISPEAGFDKARQNPQESIRVWKDPEKLKKLRLFKAIKPWNEIAGWDLFKIVNFEKNADVKLVLTENTGWQTECSPSPQDSYTSCIIRVPNPLTFRTVQHELGHTLGFADHIKHYDLATYPAGLNPRVCDDVNSPLYSPHERKGIMSSCGSSADSLAFGKDDIRLLSKAGYAKKWGNQLRKHQL